MAAQQQATDRPLMARPPMTEAAAKRAPAPVTQARLDKQLSALSCAVGDAIGEANQRLVKDLQRIIDGLRADIAELRAGNLAPVAPWSPGTFAAGAVVTHAGSSWRATRETTTEPPSADWLCIAAAGRSMSVRGTWAEGETYRHLDVVARNGASFVARRDNPGTCPGDGWQLLSSQGKRGRAPAVAGMALSGTVLTLRNGDGSSTAVDLAPLLSKIAGGRLA
jgi:hypothetical protein